MLLSNIAAAVVCLICVIGLLRIIYVNKNEVQVEIDRLIEQRKEDRKTIMTLSEAVNDLYDKLREKEDVIQEQEKEIRRWNEGISNIMNYSLDVAKGGNKP